MVFSIEQYIDEDFEQFQKFIGDLSESTPIIDSNTINNEEELIRALVEQNKAYAQKILTLYEELANTTQDPENGQEALKDTFHTSKPIERHGSNPESGISAQDEEGKGNLEQSDATHLAIKIEYLNSLFMEAKQTNEEKEGVIKDLTAKYQERENLFKELETKNEELLKQIAEISNEKEQAEKDLEELMEEFVIVKEKYQEGSSALKEKEKLLSEFKKKSGNVIVTPRKTEPERIPESNEEVEELKEKLELKEKTISDLKAQMNSISVENSKDDDLSPLQSRILNLGSRLKELRAIIYDIASNADIRTGERTSTSPTRPRRERLDQDELSAILDKEHFVIVDNLNKVALELAKQPTRIQPIDERERPSAHSARFVEELLRIKAEIEEQLKVTLQALAERNRDELVIQLEQEIDKNAELTEKIEKLSYALQKVLLTVQEDYERLSMIHEYARKAVTTEELRTQIQACKNKVKDLLQPELLEKMTLNEEYEEQRKLWQEKIAQQASQFKEDLTILREELENQRNITLQKELEFTNQINTIKQDYEESKRQYSNDIERYSERIDYLEQEKENNDKYIKELKKTKSELQNIVSEREDTILDYTNKVSEWQAKCSFIENDIRKALNDKNRMQDIVFEKEKEIELLKDDCMKLQANQKRQAEALDHSERTQRSQLQEISSKNARIQEIESLYESERKKLWEQIEHLKVEYRTYVEETERSTEQLKENYENLLNEYNVQLEDLRRYTDQMKKTHENQTENYLSEIKRLSRGHEEAVEISRSQAENLRVKEEKLNRVTEELRTLEFKARTMEDNLSEMNTIKDKNKRYFELLQSSNNELNNVKIEIQGLLNERNEAFEKATRLEKGYIEIREELRKALEKIERSKEVIQENQTEIRGLKEELDRNHKKLMEKEKELRNLNDEFNSQTRTTMGYKDETINRLKLDLKQVTTDYEGLRREYQDIIERNEDVMLQNEKLKQIVFDKEVNFNEIEKLNNLNDDLLVQNEQLKNEKRTIQEDAEREKRSLAKEINVLKNKLFELQNSQTTRSK